MAAPKSADITIESLALAVRRIFLETCRHIENSADSSSVLAQNVRERLDRYLLWAGNLGALIPAQSTLSLDRRLSTANATEIKEQICRLLRNLQDAISDLQEIICHGGEDSEPEPPPPDEPDPEITDEILNFESLERSPMGQEAEAQSILEVISRYLKSMFLIGVLIRRTGPRDRFQRALDAHHLVFDPHWEKDRLTHSNAHTKLRQPSSRWLLDRLAVANAKRRQVINYCRDHADRLEAGLTSAAEEAQGDDSTRSQVLSQHSRALTKATTVVPWGSRDPVDILLDDDRDDASFTSASTTTGALFALRLPRLEELSQPLEPFKCPLCFTIQVFEHDKSWQKHAFKDLEAYVCTASENQACQDMFFGDRDSWFEHEVECHKAKYRCALCPDSASYDATSKLEAHLTTNHGPLTEEQIAALTEHGREAPGYYSPNDCPFCDDWGDRLWTRTNPKGRGMDRAPPVTVKPERFKCHVAAHQEQVALAVAPRPVEDNSFDVKVYDTTRGLGELSSISTSDEDESGIPDSGAVGSASKRSRFQSPPRLGEFDRGNLSYLPHYIYPSPSHIKHPQRIHRCLRCKVQFDSWESLREHRRSETLCPANPAADTGDLRDYIDAAGQRGSGEARRMRRELSSRRIETIFQVPLTPRELSSRIGTTFRVPLPPRELSSRIGTAFRVPLPPWFDELEEPEERGDLDDSELLARELPYYEQASLEIDSP